MFNAHIQDDLPLIAGGLASPDGYIMAGGSGNFVINEVPELKWSGGIAQQPVIRYFGPSGETNKACAVGFVVTVVVRTFGGCGGEYQAFAVKEIGRAHVSTPVTTAQLVCR